MRTTRKQLRRIIKESKGWFLLGLDGTLAKSQKTRTPIWWSNEAGAQQAYDNGYGGEGAVPVEVMLVPDPYAYNGSNADPADLESVRQHWAPGTLNKVPSELGESKMKITKHRLRRIIKEEVKRVLVEQGSRAAQLGKIENEISNARVIDFGIDAEQSAVRAIDFNYGTVQKIQDWLKANGFSVAFVDEDNHGIASVITGPNVWSLE